MIEEWKPIGGYENKYHVSNFGNIKFLEKTVICGWNQVKQFYPERVSKGYISHSGYYVVKLCKDGVCIRRQVHQLVMEAFVSNPENKPHINHIDAVKTNNHVSNLEWCTPNENVQHAKMMGLYENNPRGEDIQQHVLNESEVRQIKKIGRSVPQRKIAKMYNVNQSTIFRILIGKTWKHVS